MGLQVNSRTSKNVETIYIGESIVFISSL